MDELFAAALAHHQAGRLGDAEALYRRILAIAPHHAEALHLLGVLAHQVGRHDAAVELIAKAIAEDGRVAAFHSNLGLALQGLGEMDAAVAAFRRALSLTHDYADAHNNLGIALRRQGKPAEAAAAYRRALALRPDSAETCNNLGNALRDQGAYDAAMACFSRALALKPDYPDACDALVAALLDHGRRQDAVAAMRGVVALTPNNAEAHYHLGNAHRTQGRMGDAVACLRRALVLTPDFPEALNNLGSVLKGQPTDALPCLIDALVLRPAFPQALNNLASALLDMGDLEAAVAAYARALALEPDYAEAYSNLGSALQDQGRLAEAMASYRRALVLAPDDGEAHNNLGRALTDQGKLAAAIAAYGRALILKPGFPEAHHNLGMLFLLSGRLDEGWPGYDWRWAITAMAKSRRDFSVPRWRGEDLEGRTILLHAEQGLGDAIQFSRYVPLVAARGGSVLLEVPRPLMRLLAGLAGVGQMVARGDPLPPFDLHCPLLSLPRVFGTRVETIPAPIPYLAAEAERVGAWRDRLGPSGFRIGIVWQGSPGYKGDRHRSIPLACFAPLGRIPGVRLISLQKAHGLDQLERLPEGMTVETLGTDFDADPFLDTAAVLMNLDLVVAVDSAVGHLAGALGRPLWLPLATMPHWIWMLERDDSPWYPRTRLFRQSAPGDWPELFERMASALRGLTQDG